MEKFIKKLKEELNKALPGKEAHKLMSPILERNWIDIDKEPYPKGLKKAAVLCLFYRKDTAIHFLLMKRTASNFAHSKQISFPGGSIDANETEVQAALRELHEEIGIQISDANIIGKLSNIYIPISNFKVFPFLAYIPKLPPVVLSEEEVDYIIEVKLSDLQNDALVKEKMMATKFGELPIKYFDFAGEVVWGATAVILSELKQILLKIDLQ